MIEHRIFILDNLTHEETESQLHRVKLNMTDKDFQYVDHDVFNSNITGKFKIVASGRSERFPHIGMEGLRRA